MKQEKLEYLSNVVEKLGWRETDDESLLETDNDYEFDFTYKGPESQVMLGINYSEDNKEIWSSLETVDEESAGRILEADIEMTPFSYDEGTVYSNIAVGADKVIDLAKESYEVLKDR